MFYSLVFVVMSLLQRSSASEFTLLRSRINYHNFSVGRELLHHAVQVTVEFTLPPGQRFPIMLLFRWLFRLFSCHRFNS